MAKTKVESDRYETDNEEARVAYVLGRALSLSDQLKTTVQELAEVLRSTSEEGEEDHSE